MPVLPARPTNASAHSEEILKAGTESTAEEIPREEEFEPWQENSGTNEKGDIDLQSSSVSRKAPPPLPARRQRSKDTINSVATSSPEKAAAQEDLNSASALRVPESSADAINAENSTPERAHGATDDTAHLAHDEGVDAEISGARPARAEDEATAMPTSSQSDGKHSRSSQVTQDSSESSGSHEGEFHAQPVEIGKEHIGGDEEVLARIRARVRERSPLVEKSTAMPPNTVERDHSTDVI